MQLLSFGFSTLIFFAATFASFSFPGIYIVLKVFPRLEFWEKFFYGTVVGLVAFTLVSYVLWRLGFPSFVFPVFIVFDFFAVRAIFKYSRTIELTSKRNLLLLLSVFVTGLALQLAVISPSGRLVAGDLIFYGSHAHDASWHIAVMNAINKGFPFSNPVLAGEKLVNYHFFSDIAPAFFNKYLNLPALDLYFRFFPFLESLLLGATAFLLTKRLGKSFLAGIWGAIFVFFAGSFGYVATLIQGRGISGESLFWATQVQSSISNPPQIISNFLILTLLSFLITYLAKPKMLSAIVIILVAGSLATFKIYAAVPVLATMGITSLWRLAKDKKFDLLWITAGAGVLTAALYLPNTSASITFLIFQPWWFIRTMVVEPSRLNWIDLELRRQFYLARGGWRSFLRIVEYEGLAFFIFFVGNLGTRILGLGEVIKTSRKFFSDYFSQIFILIIVISFALPLLFLQKGVAGNTAQFLQYFILLFGVLAAVAMSKLITKIHSRALKIAISLVIVLLSVPTQLSQVVDFYSRTPFAKISAVELTALTYLKENTTVNSVILSPPYDKNLDLGGPTPNIWDWFDTAYISAFSQRSTYLADTEQADILGYNFAERRENQINAFTDVSPDKLHSLVKGQNISYLYFPKALKPAAKFDSSFFERVFNNDEVEIWKVK